MFILSVSVTHQCPKVNMCEVPLSELKKERVVIAKVTEVDE